MLRVYIIKITSLFYILLFFYFLMYIYILPFKYDSIADKCSKYDLGKNNKKKYLKYISGKELWKYLLKHNNNEMCYFFNMLSYFKVNDSYYYHRLYNSNVNISNKGIFPDESYNKLIPKNKHNFQNVLTHTYEVQNYIYKHQHPINCANKKYIIIRGYASGHGSEIHVMTSYLALALSLNRIAVLDPYIKSMKANGKFCKKYKNWLCFIEQLSNCSLSHKVYKSSVKFIDINQTDRYIYIGGTLKLKNTIPPQIINITKYSPIFKNKLIHYWRIQASTYIFRLNEATDYETNIIIFNSLRKKIYNGCFNIWVRHGDKFKEMRLLNAEDYIPSYEIYKLLVGKNIPIYLSTDDGNVTKFYDSLNITKIYYLNFSRKNDNFSANMKRGDEMTLNFIADIKAALYCDAFSGTRSSNVVRLIDELRSTVGLSANSFYFENGDINISNGSYEYTEFW